MGTIHGWLLDEIASAGRENLDVGHVARYDGKMHADAENELDLLQQLGLSRQSEIVDIGAGTGQFAVAAASACARVVAVDVSPVMLDRLKRNIVEANVSNVEIVHAGFRHLRASRPSS